MVINYRMRFGEIISQVNQMLDGLEPHPTRMAADNFQ